MAKSVLVLGCDERAGLTVIRSLGRAGIAVDVAWLAHPFATKSRYVRNVFDLPDPNDGSGSWLDPLQRLLIKYQYDLVLPCNDRAIIPIQQKKVDLGRHARIYALTDDAFLATFNKYQTTLLAERCNVHLPQWTLIRFPQESTRASDSFTFPVVLKPISSFGLERATVRREVQTIRDRPDFTPALEKMLHDGPVQVQAFFRGRGVGVELLAKEGHVLVAFQHERVHEPPAGGGSSYRRSVPLDASLFNAAKKLVASLRYTGVMMVEFRVNPESGDWTLIEINGRFWGSLPLAAVSGIDFPLYLYQMLVDGRADFPKGYKTGVYCRNLSLDLRWFKENLTADRNDPTLQIVPLRRVLAEFRNVLTLSDHIDTFALDDPMPFITEVNQLIRWAIRTGFTQAARIAGVSKFRKTQRAKCATEKLRNAKSVTFVCYGNICRSPFAEAYARAFAPKTIRFSSAGTFPLTDRRSPREACVAAKAIGVDLESHRSRGLSTSLVKNSDVIIVFDHQNLRDVLRQFPQAKSRIVRFGDFLPGRELEISDPYGQLLEQYEHCFRTIAELLTQLWSVTSTNRAHYSVLKNDATLTR